MKILILGAGRVGGILAHRLASEAFDITLVDRDAARLRELRERLDIQTVTGWASHPDVLARAGAEDADMLIAVTGSDEVNMVACQVCYSTFRTHAKIARVRSAAYLQSESFFHRDHLPIDVLINPERVVTDQIQQLLENPGALQVLDFAEGKVKLVAVRVASGSALVGKQVRQVREQLPKVKTRLAAIFRRDSPILPKGDTRIEADDELFFIAAAGQIGAILAELRDVERPFRRVTIAGGGEIGALLARAIEPRFSVKLVEQEPQRAAQLAESLQQAVVLNGDATNWELLIDENIQQCDAFCAVTDDDEANIMSCLMAKRLGAHQVMALIGNPAYVSLVQGIEIDIAISPEQATTSSLLTHIRRGDVARVHSLRSGAAEALETVAHGDRKSSKVVGRPVKSINLPPDTSIVAIVRGDQVLVSLSDVVVQSEDHLILFLANRRHVAEVERLFQVGLSFF